MELFRKFGLWIGLLLLLSVLGLWWWLQPERQVRRAQARLIAAVEGRDVAAFEQLLGDDYRDRWGLNKAIVVSHVNEVLRQFLFLSVEYGERDLQFGGDTWAVRGKVLLKGSGGPLANHAKDELGRLREPFTITWRRNGGPTEWVVVSVEQPELEFR